MSKILLSATNLCCQFGTRSALSGIDLEVASGEIICVLGPNGSGKSTLLKTLIGITPFTGEIALLGTSMSRFTRRQIGERLSYVPQNLETSSPYTVREFVITAMYATKLDRKLDAAKQALSDCLCDDLLDRDVASLSGGERQRVLIASAVAQGSQILLLDEPFASMDLDRSIKFIGLFSRLKACGKALIIVLHDLNWATFLADRILYIRDGRALFAGSPVEFLAPKSLELILGKEYHLVDNPHGGLPLVVPRLMNA